MVIKKVIIIFIIICCALKSEAQLYKLLNLTEQEVRKEVTKYHFVDRREHDFNITLTFKNRAKEIEFYCVFYFGLDKCGSVRSFESIKNLNKVKKKLDKQFTIIGSNRWRSKEGVFEVYININDDKMLISYSRGFSTY